MSDPILELVDAIREQTRAIQALADSNADLIAAMAEVDHADDYDDTPPRTYMDGSPCL